MRFGGMGGLNTTREPDRDDAFEMAVERALGDRIRADDQIARDMWSALADVEWKHVNGDSALYSLRAAGDMIASIRRSGNYRNWYCCQDYNRVSQAIANAMKTEGWTFELDVEEAA